VAIWKSINGCNSKMPTPLHKKIIVSEPGGHQAECRWQTPTLERIGR